MPAVRREREPDPGVVIEVHAESRARARHHVAVDLADQAFTAIVHSLRAVRCEEPREARAEQREADLQLAADPRLAADVADVVARLRVISRDRPRELRLLDEGITVREAEVVDVLAELPIQRPLLAHAEQVRLIESDEASDAGALPHRRAEVHVPRALLL